MPEKTKVEQLPRSVDVILYYDLVDHVKPGYRVHCVGVCRSLPNQHNNVTNGVFRMVLILCNNVSLIGKIVAAVRLISSNDVKKIRS